MASPPIVEEQRAGFLQRLRAGDTMLNRLPVLPAAVLAVLIGFAIFAPLLAPHDPVKTDIMANLMPPVWHAGGSFEYILGTDKLGRDILSRIIYGARLSLSLSLIIILLGGSVNWTPKWSTEGTVQYNPDMQRSNRTTLGARYQPGPYRSLYAAYRFQRETTPQANDGCKSIDFAWQWPLNDLWGDKGQDLGPGRGQGGGRWYAVGRLNYSMEDNKLTDGIVGLEYDACCWIGRVVLERLTTGQTSANTRIMFQLEFVGFAAVGTSPLRSLQSNIRAYQPLRQRFDSPSRFTQYD